MTQKNVYFIADDDPDDQELFIKALKEVDEFCSCITAFNGEDAINKLNESSFSPDIIFLDLNMPKMNGKQCLKEIKASKKLHQIPVIIYSTSIEKNEVDEATDLGAVFFLQKPNRFDDLCNAISKIILHNWNKI